MLELAALKMHNGFAVHLLAAHTCYENKDNRFTSVSGKMTER
jgi:hypothetical protein